MIVNCKVLILAQEINLLMKTLFSKYGKIFSSDKKMRDFSLKYKIQEKLEQLNYKDYGTAIQELPKVLGITPRTFQRYLKTRVYEDYSIPSDCLVKLSQFFSCRVEDLLNYDPPPLRVKGIRKHGKIDIRKKFKLVK